MKVRRGWIESRGWDYGERGLSILSRLYFENTEPVDEDSLKSINPDIGGIIALLHPREKDVIELLVGRNPKPTRQ
jgi:hypothetical protein